ncbi:MAG: hypothetical protein ACXADA_11125 [Candidatus Hodarchaeales archaeon]|jgi:hypothetical protein
MSDFGQEVLKILESRLVQNRRQMEDDMKRYIDGIRVHSSVSRYELDNFLRKLGETLLRLEQDFSTRDNISYAKEIARRVKLKTDDLTEELNVLKENLEERENQLSTFAQIDAINASLKQSIEALQSQLTTLHEENQQLSVQFKKKSEESDKFASELEDVINTNIQVAQDIQKRDAAIDGLKTRLEEQKTEFQDRIKDLLSKHESEMAINKQEWELKLASAVVQQAKSPNQEELETTTTETVQQLDSESEIKEESVTDPSDDEYSRFKSEISDLINVDEKEKKDKEKE